MAFLMLSVGCAYGGSPPPQEPGLPESAFNGQSITLAVGASVRVSVVDLRVVTSKPSVAAVVEPVARARDGRPSIVGVAPGEAELRLQSACFICYDRQSGVPSIQEVLHVHVVPSSLP
jgi:hypothetical protein